MKTACNKKRISIRNLKRANDPFYFAGGFLTLSTAVERLPQTY